MTTLAKIFELKRISYHTTIKYTHVENFTIKICKLGV